MTEELGWHLGKGLSKAKELMIVLGTLWFLLSIFCRLFQLSIFRISRTHTTKKTCSQIKKREVFHYQVWLLSIFSQPSFHSWVPILANGTLEEVAHVGNVYIAVFALFSFSSVLSSSSSLMDYFFLNLFWTSLNNFYIYVSLY